jgi:hypothetical protein
VREGGKFDKRAVKRSETLRNAGSVPDHASVRYVGLEVGLEVVEGWGPKSMHDVGSAAGVGIFEKQR